MRINTQDLTLERNYLQKYQFLMSEYEQVKQKKHPHFLYVKDFYKYHDTCAKSFLKYYNRWKQSGLSTDLLPQKRGPKYKTRRPLPFIEQKVLELREKGNNRYEIVNILKPTLKSHTPSASGVYNILRRAGQSRLHPRQVEHKRRIIKHMLGELGHLDCHYLSKSIIKGVSKKLYLVCLLDDCSRIAWAEVVEDIKSLTVMFALLKCFNILNDEYHIKFAEVLTDNGSEFGIKTSQQKLHHPVERLLMELDITHRYTKPYRPQTNGKVERFWRTIEEDLLIDTYYESLDELKQELINYLVYYNNHRPHQALEGKTPAEFAKNLLPN